MAAMTSSNWDIQNLRKMSQAHVLETICVEFHRIRPSRLGCRADTDTHTQTHRQPRSILTLVILKFKNYPPQVQFKTGKETWPSRSCTVAFLSKMLHLQMLVVLACCLLCSKFRFRTNIIVPYLIGSQMDKNVNEFSDEIFRDYDKNCIK